MASAASSPCAFSSEAVDRGNSALLQVASREFLRRIGRGEARGRVVEGVVVGPLVDGEQQVALLDDRPIGEMDPVQIARHPRAQVDRVDRLEAADEVVALGDLLDDRSRDRDRRGVLRHGVLAHAELSEQAYRSRAE